MTGMIAGQGFAPARGSMWVILHPVVPLVYGSHDGSNISTLLFR